MANSETTRMSPCSVCASDMAQQVFTLDEFDVSRCRRCSHLFVSNGLAEGALSAAYGHDYYDAGGAADAVGYQDYLRDAELRTRGFRERLKQIETLFGKRGRLLDYGCAVGLFVRVATESGWAATGYERSEWAAQYGREHFGLDIVLGDGRNSPAFESRFDVVTMWDVVEHLEHPRDVIQSISKWLRPGGLLALNTVNSSSAGARLAGRHWRHLAPPHHLQYFSRASLRRLLNDSGFDVLSRQNQGVMLTADVRKKGLRGVAGWTEAMTTHWRAKPLATALNLLDEIEMIAVRR